MDTAAAESRQSATGRQSDGLQCAGRCPEVGEAEHLCAICGSWGLAGKRALSGLSKGAESDLLRTFAAVSLHDNRGLASPVARHW